MVNHIPNNHLLTNKLGLLQSLQRYNRACESLGTKKMELNFIPETFYLDNPADRREFRNLFKGTVLFTIN